MSQKHSSNIAAFAFGVRKGFARGIAMADVFQGPTFERRTLNAPKAIKLVSTEEAIAKGWNSVGDSLTVVIGRHKK